MSEKASPPRGERMHWTTKIGVVGVVLCVLVVASLNVTGWLTTLPGAPGVAAAAVAVGLELIAFVAWEHVTKYAKARDWGRLPLAIIGLALAVVVNVEGGHRGIEHIAAPLYESADADRRDRQEALDAERTALALSIERLQGRVDAVAATNPGITLSGRMEAWRDNFEIVTAEDRAQIATLRVELNALPMSVAVVRPFPAWGPYALTAAFAFLSLFGLTMFGIKVAEPDAKPGRADPAQASTSRIEPVLAAQLKVLAPWPDLATAWRLSKHDGWTHAQIGAHLGISKAGGWRRLVAAQQKLDAHYSKRGVTPLRSRAA